MLKPVAIVSAFIVFSAFIPTMFSKGVYKNDLEIYNLKGRVKSCTEYHHEINDPKFLKIFNPKIKQNIATSFYNRKGYRTKMMNSTIDNSGKVVYFSSHKYDAKAGQAGVSAGGHIEYDKFGHPRIIYNKFGQRDTVYNPDKKGKLRLAIVYRYDKNHNIISLDNYLHEDIIIGKAVYKTLYRYGKYNNRIEEINLDAKGQRVSKINYQYDSRGNVLLEIDSAVKRIGSENRPKLKNNIYTISYTYKNFDRVGNWLQKITVVNNQRSYSTKRKIKYYN